MSIRVLISDFPHRSIALVNPSNALIFRHSPSPNEATHNGSVTSFQGTFARNSTDGSAAARCMVEFVHVSSADLSDYRTLAPLPVHGTLGLITINNDVFLSVITSRSKVATVRPGETVERISGVEFYCLNSSDYDHIFSDGLDPYSEEGSEFGQGYTRREPLMEHPTAELRKLLSNGSFYYSTDFDLTNRLQDRSIEAPSRDTSNLDESFLWNSYMIDPLVKFRSRLVAHERAALDKSGILTSAIRGFVETNTIPSSSAPLRTSRIGLPSTLTIISRLSCRRAGTRFNSRGIDDDGNVANFVESETVFWSPSANSQTEPAPGERPSGICFSYAQIRGSVPVFWEQAAGLLPGQQKITITRSAEGTQPAFDKHFGELEHNYGAVHVVNLLSATKPGEAELTYAYQKGIRHSALNQIEEDHKLLQETVYDFHAETKGPSGYEAAKAIRHEIEPSADGFAYYLSEETEDPVEDLHEKPHRRLVVILQQEGVFRTNCLDCLDRTNLIQTIISQMAVESFLAHRGVHAASDFWMRHSSLWADNGDALSRIYAGTGALKSSFTRHGKMSLAGAIADARKSATRLYINNFADKGRQNTIDVLLGRLVGQTPVHLFDPINDYVTAELAKRSSEYQSSKNINIWCGTYNLNGKTTGIDQDLSSWLCPELEKSQQQPEIVAVGFQEIVELSPQQIMNSDPRQKQKWEEAVRKTLNHYADGERYVLLRSGQLVGAALCIFVKSSVLKHIKNVEGSIKKTGMSGMAGNKGAVAIRMDYAKTQICFVTAHLAAGFSNYEERNRDYVTIHHGLRFQRNRGIDNHDTVIWMGDFNYRIGLGAERVKSLIKMGDLETLYENDQLNLQMVAGLTFPYYSESRITFDPTYKYDLGTDTYDTSEKARIPAWTDRILRKGTNIRQINYNTAALQFSDHRPVYATFQCTVSIVDEEYKETLSRKIYEQKRSEVGHPTINDGSSESDDEDLIGYDAIDSSLPPASSDKRKWWLDNGQPARSNIQPPQQDYHLNENRPSNPYTPTDEPDWVKIPRANATRIPVNKDAAPPPPNPRQPTNGTRKLPPPFKASNTSVDALSRTISSTSLKSPTPDLPTARRPSTVSLTSVSSKKGPPPVARKPLHLTGPASPNISPQATTINAFAPISRPPAQPPRPTAVDQTGFAPPPRRANGNTTQPATGSNRKALNDAPAPPQPRRPGKLTKRMGSDGPNDDDDDEGPKPSLPPRRPTDLLATADGDELLGSWTALRPT